MGEPNNVLWKKELRDLEESSTDESEKERRKVKKIKKLLKKEKRKTEKLLKKKLKYEKKLQEKSEKKKKLQKKEEKPVPVKSEKAVRASESGNSSADVPLGLMERSKAMAPMTKEEWDKRQSIVRRVLDEESGRYRLIKGDGEVLEEIVSYDRHKEINQKATRADGAFFQSQTVDKKKK